MRAHLHMQLSLSMSLVLKSAPWITRLLCLPAVPLWLFRNSLKDIRRKRSESGLENMYVGGSGGEKHREDITWCRKHLLRDIYFSVVREYMWNTWNNIKNRVERI